MRQRNRPAPTHALAGIAAALLFLTLCAAMVFIRISTAERSTALARLRAQAVPEPVPTSMAPFAGAAANNLISTPSAPAVNHARHWQKLAALAQKAEEDKPEQEFWLAFQEVPASEITEEDWQQLDKYLGKHRELLDAIHILARTGTHGYAIKFEDGLAMELAHLSRLRGFARMLRGEARRAWHEGRDDDALEHVLDIWPLGDCLKDEPILVSQLVRISIHGIACSALTEIVAPGQLDPGQSQQLLELLATVEYRPSLHRALLMEAETTVQFFDEYSTGKWGSAFLDDLSIEKPDTWMDYIYSKPLGRPLMHRDQASYLQVMEQIASLVPLPFHEARPGLEAVESKIARAGFLQFLTPMFAAGMPRALRAPARAEALCDITMAGLLVEQYHNEHGVYPATLGDIPPHPSGGDWTDPFTGQPYHYDPSPTGICLYSVGHNLHDDGGLPDHREGDIVWRAPME